MVVAVENGLDVAHKDYQSRDPICSACDKVLVGVLHYKCVICTNFLLCRGCRVTRLQKKLHLEHRFRPISSIGTLIFIFISCSYKILSFTVIHSSRIFIFIYCIFNILLSRKNTYATKKIFLSTYYAKRFIYE